jgi:hypothetical protein
MSRRDEWNRVLAIELERWKAKPWSRLRADVGDGNVTYEVVADSKTYQVEVDILEDTQAYLHVSVAVDDGSLPASIVPASTSFIVKKVNSSTRPD